MVMKTIIRIEKRGPKLFNASSRNLRFRLSSPKKRLWCVQTQRHSENQPNYCIWDSTLNLEYDHVKGLLSVLLEAIYIVDRLYHYIGLQTFDKTGMKLNLCIG